MMVSGGDSTGVGVVSLIGSALQQSFLLVVVVWAFYDNPTSCLDSEGVWQSLVGCCGEKQEKILYLVGKEYAKDPKSTYYDLKSCHLTVWMMISISEHVKRVWVGALVGLNFGSMRDVLRY